MFLTKINAEWLLTFMTLPVLYFLNWNLVYCIVGLPLIVTMYWVYLRIFQHSCFLLYGFPFQIPHLLYGNIKHLKYNDNEIETEVVDRWITQYGKVVGFYDGRHPNLIISDIDINKILFLHSSKFDNRPDFGIKVKPIIDTLYGMEDKKWNDVRKFLLYCFSANKLMPLFDVMNEKIDILLDIVSLEILRGDEVEFSALFEGLSLDVLSTCSFSIESECQILQNEDPLFSEVRQLLKQNFSKDTLWTGYAPIIEIIVDIINTYWVESGKETQIIISRLKEEIRKRRNSTNIGNRKDILQILLDASTEAVDEVSLTDDEIIASTWVFLLSGYETIASALTFLAYQLAVHPDIQETVYQEICDKVRDPKKNSSYNEIASLDYLEKVFKETVRVMPPLVSYMMREAKETIHINGVTIPRGINVYIPIWHIHHNTDLWAEPLQFNPERFTLEMEDRRPKESYFAFGGGIRNCIGQWFGKTLVKLALVRILAHYRLESSQTPDPLTFIIPTDTLRPKDKVFLRVVKR